MASLPPKKRRLTVLLDVLASVATNTWFESEVADGNNVFDKYATPETLCNYVVTFFWDDAKTLGQWLQACRQNHSLCLDKMTAMKVWWDEVQSLTLTTNSYTEYVREEVFHASFSKRLDLSKTYLGHEACEQVASALANTTALKELDLSGNPLLSKEASRHFVFQLGSIKLTYTDGAVYEGEWKDGKSHGQGKCTYPDGAAYEGDWKDDKKHGQGKLTYPDGAAYEGDWKDGKKHGQGKYTYADGRRYEGEFQDDKFSRAREIYFRRWS